MPSKWNWTDEQVDRAYELLKDSTKASRVKAVTLEEALGVEHIEGRMKSRDLITEVMRRKHLPLGSGNTGFYVIRSEDELKIYREALTKRILGVENRIDLVEKAYLETYGSLPDEEEVDDEEEGDDA